MDIQEFIDRQKLKIFIGFADTDNTPIINLTGIGQTIGEYGRGEKEWKAKKDE